MSKTSELTHLFRALKAPAAARATPKLAQRVREEDWSRERVLEAVLSTEVASRQSHGGESRTEAARSSVPCFGSRLEHGGRARRPLQQLRDEIAHFFSIHKRPEGIAVRVDGWRTLQEALEVIADSRRRFDEQGG